MPPIESQLDVVRFYYKTPTSQVEFWIAAGKAGARMLITSPIFPRPSTTR